MRVHCPPLAEMHLLRAVYAGYGTGRISDGGRSSQTPSTALDMIGSIRKLGRLRPLIFAYDPPAGQGVRRGRRASFGAQQ